MWFKKKDVIRSEECEFILKKISTLQLEVGQIEARLKALNTNYDDLRGKFNRKLNIIKKEEEEGQETENNLKAFTPFG